MGQPPDDAEVEQRRASVGQHEQVAAVQVAVEDAVDQRALHEGDHPGADHGLGVDPGVAHAGGVVEAEPGDPLHHQDPAGHELRMRARDHVAVLAEVAQDGGDVEHVGRFHAEVELLDDRLGEQLDERRRVGQRGDRDAADEVGREPRHRPAGRGARDDRPTGRCTLTTTSSPVRSRAAWTWAIEAAASGVRSNDSNTSSRRDPRSSSTVRRTSSNVSAGTWSRHFLNSSTSSGGNSPSPDEMIWPSLM